jgi:hypothetical protein
MIARDANGDRTLPPSLWPIARVTSPKTALALARLCADERLYIPKRTDALVPTHRLVAAIGLPAARRLVEAFGGTRLVVPSARVYLRHREVKRLHRLGVAATDISRRVGLSRARVRIIIASLGDSHDRSATA